MHPFLTRLGIAPAVQDLFEPYYKSDETGNLVFSYGEEAEHFGFAFHRVPASGCWLAGNTNLSMISHIFICESAMEAISYFSLNEHAYRWPEQCLFIAGHPVLKLQQKSISLIFNHDILGSIRELKVAAAIRGLPLSAVLSGELVHIRFRHDNYDIPQQQFSLSALEKLSGYRFGVRVCKSKSEDCWLEQLKSDIFKP
jgi:hypothetical protein